MPDREKVIKALEWCMCEKHDCYSEKGCPYENEGDDVGCKYALHRDALALLKALTTFKRYFDGLYGQGLEVANWHMNGATEPFDSFYDSAMEEYENDE